MKAILFGAALTVAGLSLATTGCAVGRHQANKRDRQENQAQPAR